MISSNELRRKYIDFFVNKGHKEIPSASLVPNNDPTVLFTTAGMHPLVPYLLGEKHPLGKRLVNSQRCIRTGDIDDVGDSYHHTFFEMLGNWSLGDYFKEDAIKYTFEFHTKILKIPLERYAVTVFSGNNFAKKDLESEKTWLSLGLKKERIAFLEDNWWGPAGLTGPCGPDTEMFYWKLNNVEAPKVFDPNDKNWVEIGNNVLMQFVKNDKGEYLEASQKNIDFGGGLERTLSLLNGLEDNYLTDLFLPIIQKIENLSNKSYTNNLKSMRIIADHIKASVFIINDGVIPSNTERGYVLRRLIRRAVRFGNELGLKNFVKDVALPVFSIYSDFDFLQKNKQLILAELEKEENKFLQTLEKGIKEFEKIVLKWKEINGEDAFLLYQSYGFPIEMTLELAREKNISVDVNSFNEEYKKHQELSKTLSAGKFKSGLADNSELTTRYHTATHLLNEALRKIISKEIKQKGSNINSERLRFDFNFDRALTKEELLKLENEVNGVIALGLDIKKEEMSLQGALKLGAQAEFGAKYPEIVSIYSIGNYSKEICMGPHVNNTKELGKFKIIKEESSASGIRRIKAILE